MSIDSALGGKCTRATNERRCMCVRVRQHPCHRWTAELFRVVRAVLRTCRCQKRQRHLWPSRRRRSIPIDSLRNSTSSSFREFRNSRKEPSCSRYFTPSLLDRCFDKQSNVMDRAIATRIVYFVHFFPPNLVVSNGSKWRVNDGGGD